MKWDDVNWMDFSIDGLSDSTKTVKQDIEVTRLQIFLSTFISTFRVNIIKLKYQDIN